MQSTNASESIDSTEDTNQQDLPTATPLEIGTERGEIERIIEEISHSGVAQSAKDVELLANEGPEIGDEDGSGSDGTIPIPVITRS